jgi:hypothetical protein
MALRYGLCGGCHTPGSKTSTKCREKRAKTHAWGLQVVIAKVDAAPNAFLLLEIIIVIHGPDIRRNPCVSHLRTQKNEKLGSYLDEAREDVSALLSAVSADAEALERDDLCRGGSG